MKRLAPRTILISLLAPLLAVAALAAPPAALGAEPVGAGTYEESSSAITYTGGWTTLNSSGSSGGAIRYAPSTASASLSFVGSEISWYTWNSASAGKVEVYLDGALKATVDNYAGSTKTGIVGYTASGLSAGPHTILITSTGTANAASTGEITHLDSFVVGVAEQSDTTSEPAANGAGTYEETSSAITFTGTWHSLASSGSSGGGIRYSPGTASASLTFSGPSITWYTWKSASAGKIQVYLDGVLKATVDNYAASTTTMVRAFTAQNLSAGSHTIMIRSSGTANASSSGKLTHFDSFVVGEASVPAVAAPPLFGSDCPPATVSVSTSLQLTAALAAAGPGTVIKLAPGTYTKGFQLTRSGTAEDPIWVCGPRTAVVQGVSTSSGTALRIDNASHVRLAGFTVNNALQGVMVKFGSNISVSDLNVKDIGYEAIHLYAFTSDSYVIGNLIERPGAVDVSFGEGVYIGTSQRRWAEVTNGQPDASDRNIIAGNTIVLAGAEPIEAKEGTSGGVIRDNVFTSHRAASRAIAWVLVTGNDWTVVRNTGSDSVQHGYASMIWSGWGKRNEFRGNGGAVDASAYGVWIQQSSSGSTAACDNWVTGAASGQTNVFCTP